MGKGRQCEVICNTRWGYCMTPYRCSSIREAKEYAAEMGMAYRIYADGKLVDSGWKK